ncbi:cadherin-like domain-containing protein, partial [Tenacibaculum finnmarkense]|uniref:cadherin-like domain-containing protein n=1 Tax=Tenacibaculum finnmarkense TaxID=2781243 RepID=UPI001E37EED9
HTGTVVKWQSSTDNFVSSSDISNSTTTLTLTNLSVATKYRAVVKSGTCSTATTPSVEMTITPTSVAGTIAGAGAVCTGTNSTELTLSGHTGTVVKWQSSTDNFVSSSDISNSTTTLTLTNLSVATKYRAVVKSGTCLEVTTAEVEIVVNACKTTATNDNFSGDEDAGDITGNVIKGDNGNGVDSDSENDKLTIESATVDANGDGTPTALTLGTPTVIKDASNENVGTITLNTNGSLVFAPETNYNGAVPTINYVVTDGTNTDDADIVITVKPIKDAIDDKNENLETNEETKLTGNLFGNLTDADSSSHSITGAKVDTNGDGTPTALVLGTSTEIKDNSGIVIGDITVNSDGTFEFTPAENYNGAVPTIGYDIVDNNDATDTNSSTLDITVKPIKDAIDDKNENLETNEETKLTGDLFDNLTDADSSNHTITGATVDTNGDGIPTALVLGTSTEIKDNSGIVIGDITVNSDGTFEFTPAENYNGAVPTIGYDIVDNNDATDTNSSTLDITVKPIKDAIDDKNENLETNEETKLTGDLFDNLTDADSSN